jgi:phosphate-selective porin OprO/OprP
MAVALATPAIALGQQQKRGLTWDDRPTIVFGEDVTLGVRVKLQFDWRAFDPDLDEDTFSFQARRLGLKGQLTRHFDYEIEREAEEDGSWKDVYLNWTTFDAVRIKGGRFKMPFGFEQNTGPTDLDFAYRSLGSSAIAPGRDKGGMVYGRFFGRALTYEAGLFDTDGDNGKLREPQFVQAGEEVRLGPTFSGRVGFDPLRPFAGDPFESLRMGVAYTNGALPEGLNSLRGEAVHGFDYFPPVYVKGRRQRLGVELDWTPGPTGFKAEWMQAREDRLKQGLGDRDLSDVISDAWYVSGTWLVTGEDKDDNVNPRRALFRGGIGAIEVGARYDQLGFRSASTSGPPLRNPRAQHILPNVDRIWTAGVNWYVNRWVKVVANAIHESFEDEQRTPEAGVTTFWSGVFRLQIVF